MWDDERDGVGRADDDPRPPVFILVCKNKRIARSLYDWLGEDSARRHSRRSIFPSSGTRDGTHRHDPRRYRSRAGDRHRQREVGRDRAGCGSRSTRSASATGRATAGPADLSGRLRGAGEEARPAAPSARPRRALHRQRRHADRGLGLQHRHARRRAAAVPVAAPVRAGGRRGLRRAATSSRGREVRRRRWRRSSACRSRWSRSRRPAQSKPRPPTAHMQPLRRRRARDLVPARAGYHRVETGMCRRGMGSVAPASSSTR